MGGVFGLDFPAVIQVAQLRGCAGEMLADLLSPVEILLINAYRGDGK